MSREIINSAWRRITSVWNVSREIINSAGLVVSFWDLTHNFSSIWWGTKLCCFRRQADAWIQMLTYINYCMLQKAEYQMEWCFYYIIHYLINATVCLFQYTFAWMRGPSDSQGKFNESCIQAPVYISAAMSVAFEQEGWFLLSFTIKLYKP